MRVVTAAQMKQIEEASLAYDLTFSRLMENAGAAAAAFIRRTFQTEGLNCMIFCGKGNNGGDGLVVARKLAESGANVVVALTAGVPASEEAGNMYTMAEIMELPIFSWEQQQGKLTEFLAHTDLIVDAIYGTGYRDELQGSAAQACEAINSAIAAVISLDLPSGVECDSGLVHPGAVQADFTVVFDSLKPVHILAESAAACGRVELVDIGIPEEAREGIGNEISTTTPELAFSLFPKRKPDAHKGDFGRLLAVCGSSAYRGAAAMSILASLRSGVGVCCLASTEPVIAGAAAKIYEATFLPLPQDEAGGVSGESIPLLEQKLGWATALILGCGLGNTESVRRVTEFLLEHCTCPIVLDADGINALDGNINKLKNAKAPLVLTPHPGELARLAGTTVDEIQQDRSGNAMRLAREWGVVLVLKGRETLIASPEGELLMNPTGNPGLAKGGSGDLLAGILGAILARGADPFQAAAGAVYLHGLAADRTAARLSQYAMLPSELLEDLAGILLEQGV